MNVISIHCDEDVDSAIWTGLRRFGIDVTAVAEERQFALADELLLEWAASHGRALFTHNARDFPRMHNEILAGQGHHAGIIVAPRNLAIGDIIRRLARICAERSPEDMRDRLDYLSSW